MGLTTKADIDDFKTAGSKKNQFNILTDIPSADDIHAYVIKQMDNSTALTDLLAISNNRKIPMPSGDTITMEENRAPIDQLELLFYLTHIIKPVLTMEIGFRYGLTAGIFLCAHALNNENGGHVPIQDQAKDIYEGIGVHTLKRLGMQNYQIMEHEPSFVLPQVFLQKLAPDLGISYINGNDTFDDAMLEFYYLDRQTTIDGIIAVNTRGSNERKDLLNFIKDYRPNYTIVSTECDITLIQRRYPFSASPPLNKGH